MPTFTNLVSGNVFNSLSRAAFRRAGLTSLLVVLSLIDFPFMLIPCPAFAFRSSDVKSSGLGPSRRAYSVGVRLARGCDLT
jgi:hypothetical protein